MKHLGVETRNRWNFINCAWIWQLFIFCLFKKWRADNLKKQTNSNYESSVIKLTI
jgi:hypothetical protein